MPISNGPSAVSPWHECCWLCWHRMSCLHPWLWCLWLLLLHKHIQIKEKKKASIIDKAKASSIYICSKAVIKKRCFNVSQGLDETLKMLLLRKNYNNIPLKSQGNTCGGLLESNIKEIGDAEHRKLLQLWALNWLKSLLLSFFFLSIFQSNTYIDRENVLLPLNSSNSADLSDLALFWSVNPFSVVASAVWPLLWVSNS